jgi:hypothetical protein
MKWIISEKILLGESGGIVLHQMLNLFQTVG